MNLKVVVTSTNFISLQNPYIIDNVLKGLKQTQIKDVFDYRIIGVLPYRRNEGVRYDMRNGGMLTKYINIKRKEFRSLMHIFNEK